MQGFRPASPALAAAFELAAASLPADYADRALDRDLTAAQALLTELAARG
jgi:hypothetical protein